MPKSQIAHLRVRLSLGVLEGLTDAHLYDARASVRELADRVAVRLTHEFPSCDIDVTTDVRSDAPTRLEVVDDDWYPVGLAESDAVRECVEKAWEDMASWLVSREPA